MHGLAEAIGRHCFLFYAGIVGCCARAMNDQASAEPPSSVMNSRRLMTLPLIGPTTPYHVAE